MTTKQRNEKAKRLRELRRMIQAGKLDKESRSQLRRVMLHYAACDFGYPEKDKLADFYPLERRGEWLVAYSGDEDDNGFRYAWRKGLATKDEVSLEFPEFHGGPGGRYVSFPSVQFNGYSTLVIQRVGWDI